MRRLSALAIARVRQQANVGVMADAMADEAFCRHVVKAIGAGRRLPTAGQGEIVFQPTQAFADVASGEVATLTLGTLHTQSTNTSVTLGERLFLKCYRRLRPGINPEVEVGRFLTEVAKFPHCVALAGTVDYVKGGESSSVALLQQHVPNQGDAWNYTLSYLARFLEMEGRRTADDASAPDAHGAYISLMQTLATRTAELHKAFGLRTGDPAFEPEPLTAQDVAQWRARVREEAGETLALLEQAKVDRRIDRDRLYALIEACAAPAGPALKTRHHGDYHLGQVLISNNDFVIIDFEGEPSRPLAEARRKHTPLRDVAGMLRSFSYARASAMMREPPDATIERLGGALELWEEQTRQAFVQAYAAASAGLYPSFDDVQGLLRLAELEKLLYELRYEINNRPAWVHIPLQGLTAMLGG